MKKCKTLILMLALALILANALAALAVDYPEVGANAIVLVDVNSNQVLYSRNADARVYPASLTKLMTALLAAEAIETGKVSLYDMVTASENSVFDLSSDGSTANIQPGETMTLQDLLYCSLLASANESCNIIAEYIGGTIPEFIEMMNARAAELGCTGTHFANTHGLPDENHYTTAYDFNLIAREASSSSLIMEICNTVSYKVPATNLSPERVLSNTNALINRNSMYSGNYYYEYARGMKTGYTSDAGYCLVSTASKDDISLLAVVMGAKAEGEGDNMTLGNFSDSIKLYEWVFNNFSYRDILKSTDQVTEVPVSMGSGTDSVTLRPGSSITALLPNDEDLGTFDIDVVVYSERDNQVLQAPISMGQVLGEVTVSRNGVIYGTTSLVAGSEVELSRLQYMKSQISQTLQKGVVKLTFWALVVLFIGYILLVIRYRIRYARYKRQAQEARKAGVAKNAAAVRAAASEKKPQAPSGRFTVYDSAGKKPAPQPGANETAGVDTGRDYFEEFFGRK